MRGILKYIGKKLRKNGMSETTWYTFGAAAGVAIAGNLILKNISSVFSSSSSSSSHSSVFNVSTISDIVAGGLAAAGFYELMNDVIPRILIWLETRKAKK